MFDLEIYWDDSGTHDSSPIAIAACYVATKDQWGEFARNWDEVRGEEGFDVFHMTDFMALAAYRKKPFCDWPQAKKTRVYRRLASIINTRVRFGFGFGVPVGAFERYAPQRVRQELAPDAFTYAVVAVFSLISEWYKKYGRGSAIQYVFEDRPGMEKVRQVWDVLKEKPELAEKIGARPYAQDGIIFRSAKDSKPLQAADILAWNIYAHMRDVILVGLPDTAPYIKPYFQMLRERLPMRLGFLADEQVKEVFENMLEFEKREGRRSYFLPREMLKKLGNLVNT